MQEETLNITFEGELKKALSMFYLVDPRDTYFQTVEDVPDYVTMAIPYFFLFWFLETLYAHVKGLPYVRFNDSVSSIVAGAFSQFTLALVKTGFMVGYTWLYTHYRIASLPWDSIWTWVISALANDFCYYVFHRAAHEMNFFWASHVTHHSSEDYNLSTALRQSFIQSTLADVFYLPAALIVPPPQLAVHRMLCTLYQFWIHTRVVAKLPFWFEYVFNTPSHHRVHHGRNPYCIDKNYGGTLIIWDRLFGTYEDEKDEEEVVFGITHPLNTWNPVTAQFHHFLHMFNLVLTLPGLKNKLCAIFYGPGWAPGKPRLGNLSEIPIVKAPWPKYDAKPATEALETFARFHFFLAMATSYVYLVYPSKCHFAVVVHSVYALVTTGLLQENSATGLYLELLRSSVLVAMDFSETFLFEALFDVSLGSLLTPVVPLFLLANLACFLFTYYYLFFRKD